MAGIQIQWINCSLCDETGRNRRFHSCREMAAKRAFKKDDIRQASIATSAGDGGGNTAGETGCRAVNRSIPFRACFKPHLPRLASSTAGGQTDARILGCTGEQGRQSKTAAPAEPSAAAIIARVAPTLRADWQHYGQLF